MPGTVSCSHALTLISNGMEVGAGGVPEQASQHRRASRGQGRVLGRGKVCIGELQQSKQHLVRRDMHALEQHRLVC